MNAGGSGFSVGNLATMSISGTLPYHQNNIDRNSNIELYERSNSTWALRYVWFVKDATVYDNSSLSFNGVDAMAFTSNNYALAYSSTDKVGVYYYDTIGQQTTTIAATLSSLIPGFDVTVNRCNSASVNNYSQGAKLPTASIKSTLEEIAKFDASNYYTKCTSQSTATLMKVQTSEINISEYSPLTVGQYNPAITCYEISGSNNTTPAYVYGTSASARNTLKVTASFVDSLKEHVSYTEEGVVKWKFVSHKIEPTGYQTLASAGINSGRQFNCERAKVGDLLEGGQFLVPMSFVNFTHETYASKQFILTSAQYYLTSEGIYASLSGSSRSISDFDYVGTTEKRVREKLTMNYNYNGTYITPKGLAFKANADTERVDQGGDWSG